MRRGGNVTTEEYHNPREHELPQRFALLCDFDG